MVPFRRRLPHSISPLEGDGFELLVPRHESPRFPMVETLVALVEDLQSPLPDGVRVILKLLVDTFTALEAQIAVLDAEITTSARNQTRQCPSHVSPSVAPYSPSA